MDPWDSSPTSLLDQTIHHLAWAKLSLSQEAVPDAHEQMYSLPRSAASPALL